MYVNVFDRGFDFIWQHLTMKDITCYWEALLMRYAALQRWTTQREATYHEIHRKDRKDEL